MINSKDNSSKGVFFSFIGSIKIDYHVLLFILFLLSSQLLFSQSNRDTLQLSKAMNDNKQFSKAEKLLAVYSKVHPNDFNVLWVYALTERWLKKYKHAKQLYVKAINGMDNLITGDLKNLNHLKGNKRFE